MRKNKTDASLSFLHAVYFKTMRLKYFARQPLKEHIGNTLFGDSKTFSTSKILNGIHNRNFYYLLKLQVILKARCLACLNLNI